MAVAQLSNTTINAAIEVRSTPLGWLAIAVGGGRLLTLCYGHDTPQRVERTLHADLPEGVGFGQATDRDETLAAEWSELAADYCDGGEDRLLAIKLDDARLTPFAREVTDRCRRIPAGETMSYGELAAECGRPKAARAVGSVMARNPWPLVVPCHRVLRTGGALGGYSAPQGLSMKERLLAMEGVAARG